MIGQRGADGSTRRGQNDAHRDDKHTVTTRNRVIGILGHEIITLSARRYSLGQSGLVYFALALRNAASGVFPRSCYFNQAVSIARCPSKVPNVPSTWCLRSAPSKTNRQINFFMCVTYRHINRKNPMISGL